MFTMNDKKLLPEVFYKNAALKNSSIFIGKRLCRSFFLIKLQVFRSATLLKRDFFYEYCETFEKAYFEVNL